MEFLIKNATVVNPSSRSHKGKKDILVKNGIIAQISSKISAPQAKIIESTNLHVSIGWMDIGAQIGEPGYEHRETLASAASSAAAGGYTAIACFPNTQPVIDNKSSLQFIKSKTSNYAVDFLPIAALSQGIEGIDITEMIDLKENGAIAFSDGTKSVQNSNLLLRALHYTKSFKGTVVQRVLDYNLSGSGQIHEGPVSTGLGLTGIPSIAETASLQRDLQLTKYAESNIVFHTISCEESCKILKLAKKKSTGLAATVAYKNLIFTDLDLQDFDTQLKLLPPVREQRDANALIKALNDHTIDAIVSNHVPLEEEKKKLEFSYAGFGATGLESCYAALNTMIGDKIDVSVLCKKLSSGPRKILQLPDLKIKVGEKANLTLFDPDIAWIYEEKLLKSKSKNSPFIGKNLKGRVLGIINGKRHYFN